MISWTAKGTEVLLNPRLPGGERDDLVALARQGPTGLIWLATSGSEDSPRLIGHTRESLLASARAVNGHLRCGSSDILANVLPTFHVGGLGLLARAHLAGARVVGFTGMGMPSPWEPRAFVTLLADEAVTITSLVPTQVYDLVKMELAAPPHLRALVVGGAALPGELYRAGRRLGWPLLPSYGSTECGSQVATASLESLAADVPPGLELLPHCRVRVSAGRLGFAGPSLFFAVIDGEGYGERSGEWWLSTDLGELEGSILQVHGRWDDYFKVGGEGLHLGELQLILADLLAREVGSGEALLLPLPDHRLGRVVALVGAGIPAEKLAQLQRGYDGAVIPPARIKVSFTVDEIPKTALGKPDRRALLRLLPPAQEE